MKECSNQLLMRWQVCTPHIRACRKVIDRHCLSVECRFALNPCIALLEKLNIGEQNRDVPKLCMIATQYTCEECALLARQGARRAAESIRHQLK